MQQIRLPWSCYAAFGAIIGACISIFTPNMALCTLLMFAIFLFKQNFKSINNLSFLVGVLIVAGNNYYQTQKIENFYHNYVQQKLTVLGEIIDVDSLVLNPSKRAIKIRIHQIAPVTQNNKLPEIITIWASNTNQLQLHDLVLLTNLETPSSITPVLISSCLRAESVQLKLTKNSAYKILSRPKYIKPNPLNSSAPSLIRQKIYTIKHQLLSKLKLKLTPTSFSLLATIFLGHKKAGDPQNTQLIRDKFQVWGLAHFLARAGLHMIMIALLIKLLLLALQIPVKFSSPVIILLIMVYHLLSWPSVSFLRALYMVISYETCKLLNLQVDSLHLLNLILIGALLSNPVQIFFLDFQLSFTLTYALVLAFRQNQYRSIAPNAIPSV